MAMDDVSKIAWDAARDSAKRQTTNLKSVTDIATDVVAALDSAGYLTGPVTPVHIERLAESRAHIRDAAHAVRTASQGHLAVFADPERGGKTRRASDLLSTAIEVLVAAEKELDWLLRKAQGA